MSAFIKENIKNGFVLEEEHLAKINDICKKRLSEKDAEAQLKYKVYRVDGLVYETINYSDITKEENSKRNKIEKITIQHGGGIDFSLSFDEREGIDIAIETDSKDFAYLLYSDVKDYIVTEAAKHRKFMFEEAIEFRNLLPFLMLPFLAWVFYIIASNQISQDAFNTVLSGSDVNQKLNYLMEAERAQRDLGDAWKAIIPLLIISVVIGVSGPIIDSLYPINIFCWGKAETSYKRIISIRGKVIWGIIIGFIISAVASFFVYYVTK